jgi:hypothetical protein
MAVVSTIRGTDPSVIEDPGSSPGPRRRLDHVRLALERQAAISPAIR